MAEEFILRYGKLDKHERNVALIKIANIYYVKEEDLKKKIATIHGSDSLMNSESEIRKIMEPGYNWLFLRLSKVIQTGPNTLEEVQKHLLNMLENISYLSSHQKTAIKLMEEHLMKFVEQNMPKRKVPLCTE